jgi:hypothetical protein
VKAQASSNRPTLRSSGAPEHIAGLPAKQKAKEVDVEVENEIAIGAGQRPEFPVHFRAKMAREHLLQNKQAQLAGLEVRKHEAKVTDIQAAEVHIGNERASVGSVEGRGLASNDILCPMARKLRDTHSKQLSSSSTNFRIMDLAVVSTKEAESVGGESLATLRQELCGLSILGRARKKKPKRDIPGRSCRKRWPAGSSLHGVQAGKIR